MTMTLRFKRNDPTCICGINEVTIQINNTGDILRLLEDGWPICTDCGKKLEALSTGESQHNAGHETPKFPGNEPVNEETKRIPPKIFELFNQPWIELKIDGGLHSTPANDIIAFGSNDVQGVLVTFASGTSIASIHTYEEIYKALHDASEKG